MILALYRQQPNFPAPDGRQHFQITVDAVMYWAESDGMEPSEADVRAILSPTPPTLDQIYDDLILAQRLLKAVVLALNDGSLPVGTNKTGAQLKAIIKAKM